MVGLAIMAKILSLKLIEIVLIPISLVFKTFNSVDSKSSSTFKEDVTDSFSSYESDESGCITDLINNVLF